MSKKQGKDLSMRNIREILRLRMQENLSQRAIAQSCNIAQSPVQKFLKKATASGLSYEELSELDDPSLCEILGTLRRAYMVKPEEVPSYDEIHQELKQKGVTLLLLWEEYKRKMPGGYEYSQFCEHYRKYRQTLRLSMRQTHKAGEKMFVDYAGLTISIHNPKTGKIAEAQIFVAVLGASNFTFAEATASQRIFDWLHSHIRAFEYFQGVPEIVVPDNLKSAVSKADYYDPDINLSYLQLARHYNCAVVPTRVRKPKDKAKAEVAVQIVERWILAVLRKRKYFSLGELNSDIKRLLSQLNDKKLKQFPGTRRTQFESIDKPMLKPLPRYRFVFYEWKKAKVNIDYHVQLTHHFYSVPCTYARKDVSIAFNENTVEVYFGNKRIASHIRSNLAGKSTTVLAHMPKNHREYQEWTPERIIEWGKNLGPNVGKVAQAILDAKAHPVLGYRTCLGIFRLEKQFSAARLNAACKRALYINGLNTKSIESILVNGLDQIEFEVQTEAPPIEHQNLRPIDYFL